MVDNNSNHSLGTGPRSKKAKCILCESKIIFPITNIKKWKNVSEVSNGEIYISYKFEAKCQKCGYSVNKTIDKREKISDEELSSYKKQLVEELKEIALGIRDKFCNDLVQEKEDELKEIQKLRENNIYGWTIKHKIGWLIFLISSLTSIYYIRNYAKKLKEKQAKDLKEDIKNKFKLWRLNMSLSVLFYAVSFYLLQQAINKWIRPNIKQWLKKREDITILSVTGILGILFLVDSYISSELKTPLQRLAIKIESADISEKEKKELLSSTQWSNENFKETLKRFGLLTIAGTMIKLLEKAFDKKFIANFCYAIPIGFGFWQILKIGKRIKKIESK